MHLGPQEGLERGAPDIEGGGGVPRDGMLYRLAHTMGKVQAVAFSDSLPSAFKGGQNVSNIGLDRRPDIASNKALRDELLRSYKGHALEGPLREGLSLQREVTEVLDRKSTRLNS